MCCRCSSCEWNATFSTNSYAGIHNVVTATLARTRASWLCTVTRSHVSYLEDPRPRDVASRSPSVTEVNLRFVCLTAVGTIKKIGEKSGEGNLLQTRGAVARQAQPRHARPPRARPAPRHERAKRARRTAPPSANPRYAPRFDARVSNPHVFSCPPPLAVPDELPPPRGGRRFERSLACRTERDRARRRLRLPCARYRFGRFRDRVAVSFLAPTRG